MIDNDWLVPLKKEFSKPYYKDLFEFVKNEYSTTVVYPPADDIFNAFHFTPLKDVKVLLLGQDPYHNVHQAHGLSFSVLPGNDIPPSLKNIYQELHDDLGCYIPNNGYLKKWADQGVLLLNTVLTVRAHQANFLWGAPAGRKAKMLTNPKHLVLKAPHPSPLSAYRGFFGCKHFSKANEFLKANGVEPIDWQIENI